MTLSNANGVACTVVPPSFSVSFWNITPVSILTQVFLPRSVSHQIYFSCSRVAITYSGWSQWVWCRRPYNLSRGGRPPSHHTKARRKLYSRGSTEAWETCGRGLYIYTGQQMLLLTSHSSTGLMKVSLPSPQWPAFTYSATDWINFPIQHYNSSMTPSPSFFLRLSVKWIFKRKLSFGAEFSVFPTKTCSTLNTVCNYTG